MKSFAEMTEKELEICQRIYDDFLLCSDNSQRVERLREINSQFKDGLNSSQMDEFNNIIFLQNCEMLAQSFELILYLIDKYTI